MKRKQFHLGFELGDIKKQKQKGCLQFLNERAHCVTVIVVGNGCADTSSEAHGAVCISRWAITLAKGTFPTILPLALGK